MLFPLFLCSSEVRVTCSLFSRGLPGPAGAHRVMPRLVAMMSTGAMSLSRARLRKEKLSMSSMWTSSMNSTWGPSGGRHTHLPHPSSPAPPHLAWPGYSRRG